MIRYKTFKLRFSYDFKSREWTGRTVMDNGDFAFFHSKSFLKMYKTFKLYVDKNGNM